MIYKALIKWYPLGVGRSYNYPQTGTKYAPLLYAEKDCSYRSIIFFTTDIDENNQSYIEFEFLAADTPLDAIDVGEHFYIREGSRSVAEGVVLSMLNEKKR